VEDQERNMAQLVRIGTVIEWRWSLKEHLQDSNKEDKEDGNNEERSKDGPRESQEKVEEEIPSSAFC